MEKRGRSWNGIRYVATMYMVAGEVVVVVKVKCKGSLPEQKNEGRAASVHGAEKIGACGVASVRRSH